MLTTTTHRFADDFGGSPGPNERRGVFIPVLDILADVVNQALYRDKVAAAYRLAGQDAEPRLDHVQPRSSGRGEVEAEVGVLLKPLADFRGRVSRGVVQNHVQFTCAIAPLQQFQE